MRGIIETFGPLNPCRSLEALHKLHDIISFMQAPNLALSDKLRQDKACCDFMPSQLLRL